MAVQRMKASAISFWERSFWKKTARRSRETIRILMLLVNTFFLIWFFHSFLCKLKKEELHTEFLSLRCNSSCTGNHAKALVERQSILSTVFHVHETVICAGRCRCSAACIGIAAFCTFPCRDIVPFVHGDLGDHAF